MKYFLCNLLSQSLTSPASILHYFSHDIDTKKSDNWSLGDLAGEGVGNYIPPMAFVLAGVASCNSVGAAVYTESLFKVS